MRRFFCLFLVFVKNLVVIDALAASYDIFLNHPNPVAARNSLYGGYENGLYQSTQFLQPASYG